MRYLYLLGFCLLLSATVNAQVGIGTEQPNLRAVLDLQSPSNDQGFLAPRLTTAQRTALSFTDALTAAENGMLVFDSDEKVFYYWIFPAWKAIEAGSTATVWRSGSGIPDNAAGEEDDFYLDLVTSDVYKKISGSYTRIANIKGDKGDTGPTGPQGPKGDKGDPGATGPQGLKGDTGPAGPQGLKGDTGGQGIQGEKGDKGDPGVQGIPGVKGDKGDPGAQGEKGDTGAQGIQGLKGDTGSQGIQGLKGDKGDTGSQGIQGLKGDKGDTGATGLPGRSTLNIREVSTSDKADADKDDILIGVGDAITIQLPPAAYLPGKVFYFRLDASDNKGLTIVSNLPDTIIPKDGIAKTSISLDPINSGVTIVSDGSSRWFVIASF